jgi:hypothetical protein
MYNKIILAVLSLGLSAAACATTYTYTGLPYNTATAPYTTAMSITGNFTTASPLPASMAITDIGPNGTNLVTSWSFTDGINTYTQANSVVLPQLGTFRIGTDATGSITSFYIQIEQPLPPHVVGQLLNVLDVVNIGFTQSQGVTGAPCLTLSGAVCATLGPAASFGDSFSSGSFAPVVAVPAIAKAFGAPSIPLGGSTSLTFTVTNPNAGAALTGVALSDTLPAGLVVATPNGLSGSCGAGTITATAAGTVVDLAGGTLAGGALCTFSVNVTGTTIGTKVNTTGNVTSTESGAGGTATASLDVLALPPAPIANIPTVGGGTLGALAMLVALAGVVALGRRRRG